MGSPYRFSFDPFSLDSTGCGEDDSSYEDELFGFGRARIGGDREARAFIELGYRLTDVIPMEVSSARVPVLPPPQSRTHNDVGLTSFSNGPSTMASVVTEVTAAYPSPRKLVCRSSAMANPAAETTSVPEDTMGRFYQIGGSESGSVALDLSFKDHKCNCAKCTASGGPIEDSGRGTRSRDIRRRIDESGGVVRVRKWYEIIHPLDSPEYLQFSRQQKTTDECNPPNDCLPRKTGALRTLWNEAKAFPRRVLRALDPFGLESPFDPGWNDNGLPKRENSSEALTKRTAP